MSNRPAALDFAHSTYLSITFPASSRFFSAPGSLHLPDVGASPAAPDTASSPGLTYVSPVGELPDAHIYAVQGVAGGEWERVREQVLRSVKRVDGVGRVEELKPKMRAKRGMDEL